MIDLSDVESQYEEVKDTAAQRMDQFHSLRDSSNERLFQELVFVILSSQTDAEQAWNAAAKLEELNLLRGTEAEIVEILEQYDIQYERKKAEQIVKARNELSQPTLTNPTNELTIKERLPLENPEKARKWLVENIPGIGLKGASHFLRNTGYGEDLGIASRHTLAVLDELGLLEDASPPSNIEEYAKMEEAMRELGEELGIPAGAIDLVLWSMKTGKVFR
ncbi:hypothetical protein [Candidatus Nanohalococcus occultus]|uniref:8-oxoguanine DNA glycosylase n=1 Tax=Candidatus Nanohalococcus occultus TaxID=2978047 RepID=UPI0039E08FFC